MARPRVSRSLAPSHVSVVQQPILSRKADAPYTPLSGGRVVRRVASPAMSPVSTNKELWSAEQSCSLCSLGEEDFFRSHAVLLQHRGVKAAVAALNASEQHVSACPGGLCVVFSEARGQYFMLYRSDKRKEASLLASRIATAKASQPKESLEDSITTRPSPPPIAATVLSTVATTSPTIATVVPPFAAPASTIATMLQTVAATPPTIATVLPTVATIPPTMATVLATPATMPVEEQKSEDESVYVINLTRQPGEKWGAGFDSTESRLTVTHIVEDGLLDAWNKEQEKSCLLVGDQIIDVNGKVAPMAMLDEFKEKNELCIKVRPLLEPEDFARWLAVAEDFEVNEDFDISATLPPHAIGFQQLMAMMKAESAGKSTIQALGDKILLSQLLDNLEVPQMPMIFTTRRQAYLAEVQDFVNTLLLKDLQGDSSAFEIVAKPTHLSNAAGAMILSKEKWLKLGLNGEKLLAHMNKYLAKRADDTESEALKSLIPGFIVQPCYQSSVQFKAPLEMRVVTIWGKARLGIWWWGRKVEGENPAPGQKPQRTAWLVRKTDANGNDEDCWEVLHDHGGSNKGFEKALEIFLQAMPAMAAAAEAVAKAVGAPFLRSDFFAGSEKWGIRLNEVAYGSGVDCRRKVPGTEESVDDSSFIARVLQEGFKLCKRRPAEQFLDALGAKGETYETMVVTSKTAASSPVARARPRLPSAAVRAFDTAAAKNRTVSSVAESDCNTVVGTGSRRSSFSLSARKDPPQIKVFSRCPPVMETRLTASTLSSSVMRGVPGVHGFPRGGGSFQAPMSLASGRGYTGAAGSPLVSRPQQLVAPGYAAPLGPRSSSVSVPVGHALPMTNARRVN